MSKLLLIIPFTAVMFFANAQIPYKHVLKKIDSEIILFFPEFSTGERDISSPGLSENSRELVLVKGENGKFTWFDATVENGEPFDYKNRLYGKGNQLMADENDFPHLAKKGFHDVTELHNTKMITGRSVSQITIDGRPWGSSGVGFMADDETIMSVILADNQIVEKLGCTHPDLARPLFHLWNISQKISSYNEKHQTGEIFQPAALIYNGNEVKIKITGSRGWQESIFNDEILGTGHIEMGRDLTQSETAFIDKQYSFLTDEQRDNLKKSLSWIHTGEMVLFYISRYGFYEGHTEYRADPVTIALVFGLTTIEAAHHACGDNLFNYYNMHFTQNP